MLKPTPKKPLHFWIRKYLTQLCMSLNKNILEEKVRREFLRLNCIKVCKKSENSQSTKKMIISSRLAGKLKHYSRHCCQKLSFNIKESTTSWNQFLFSWLCTFNFIKYALNFRASLLYEAAKKSSVCQIGDLWRKEWFQTDCIWVQVIPLTIQDQFYTVQNLQRSRILQTST